MDAWIVGGALRDRALGRPVVEVDLAVSGDAEAAARALESSGCGRAFLLSADRSPRVFRVAGRRRLLDIAEIEGDSIAIDLARRDLTVNAMAFDLASGRLLDPFGGLADLERRRLATVSEKNLADDPLRCLRAARLFATHALAPDRRTSRACRSFAPALARVASERVQGELSKLLEVQDCSAALAWAWRNGVLEPGFGLSIPGEKWKRIAPRMATIDAIPRRTLPGERRRRLRLAALAGALGLSPAEAAAGLRGRRWSTEEAGDVARLLELSEQAASGLSGDEAWLWILRAADRAPDALCLLEIQSARLRRDARRLRARLRRGRKGPEVRGRDVLDWTGVAPGPEVGRLLEAVRVEGLAGRIRTRNEARRWLQTRVPTDRRVP